MISDGSEERYFSKLKLIKDEHLLVSEKVQQLDPSSDQTIHMITYLELLATNLVEGISTSLCVGGSRYRLLSPNTLCFIL